MSRLSLHKGESESPPESTRWGSPVWRLDAEGKDRITRSLRWGKNVDEIAL